MSNVDKGAIELGHGWPVGAYCCRREASPLHTIDRAPHKDSSTTLSPFSPPPPNRSTRDHQLSIQKNFCPPPHSSSLSVDSIEDTFVCPNMATQLPLFSLNILKGFFILRTLRSWTKGGCEIPCALWVESLKKIVLKCAITFYQQLGLGSRSHLADPYHFLKPLQSGHPTTPRFCYWFVFVFISPILCFNHCRCSCGRQSSYYSIQWSVRCLDRFF